MSFQWTASERSFQADVDDMLQDFAEADLPALAEAVDRGPIRFHDRRYTERVVRELRARASEGLLFRPVSSPGVHAVPAGIDDIPW